MGGISKKRFSEKVKEMKNSSILVKETTDWNWYPLLPKKAKQKQNKTKNKKKQKIYKIQKPSQLE